MTLQAGMRHHSRAWLWRYIEAVLRRVGAGRPLSRNLPHFRRRPDQTPVPEPSNAPAENEESKVDAAFDAAGVADTQNMPL